MKIPPRSILLLFFFQIAFVKFSLSQDTLQLRSAEIIVGKIITIEDTKISYKLSTDLNGQTYIIRKSKVLYIFLESGTVINYSNQSIEITEKRAAQLAKLNKYKNSIKWEVLSSISNDICFGYERHIFKNRTIELKVAYIGAGNKNIEGRYHSKGYFLKLGYKFIEPNTQPVRSIYGSYLKPEIGFSKFEVDNIHFSSTHLILNYGKTLVIGRAVLELYGGLGMSYNHYPTDQYVNGIHYVGINRRYFYGNSALGGRKPGISACVAGGLVLSFLF